MKLKELRRYLKNGKLKFEEREGSRHLHYVPKLGDHVVSLPTIIAVSNGGGDADFINLKGVALALGLSLRELETSEACRIRRECVLLLLAWRMLSLCLLRQQQMRDSTLGEAGVKAMAVSVNLLVSHVNRCGVSSWNKEEAKAILRVLPEVKLVQANPLLKEVVGSLLQAMQRG